MEEPPPLSFPAILHNPRLSQYLSINEGVSSPIRRPPKNLRDQNGGKRWIRRKDNARFAGNPHIVTAAPRDYALQIPRTLPTFPEPLPPYLPRNARLPSTGVIPTRDPDSANAGRFSISLKGMRRDLRKSGFRTQVLVRAIESEVLNWLQVGGTVLAPGTSESTSTPDSGSGTPVGDTGTIFEISRTPLQLIWSITDDAFARYIVHCCARYYDIVSFSKEVSGQRLTYLLRPNVVYPDHRAPGGLDTPPMTDADYSSQLDTESDRGSLDFDSDLEQQPSNTGLLSTISERNISTSSVLGDERWSTTDHEETDVESVSDAGLTASLVGLSLHADDVAEYPHIDAPEFGSKLSRKRVLRRRLHSHHRRQDRSASSPSRSPARTSCYKGLRSFSRRSKVLPSSHDDSRTFYDYLFL